MHVGLVRRVLTIGTVPQPLIKRGRVVEKTPGSGYLERDVRRELTRRDIEAFSLFPSYHGREDPTMRVLRYNGHSQSGLTGQYPIFTNTPGSAFRFDQMTRIGFERYLHAMTGAAIDFINDIEATSGDIDIIHISHLFANAAVGARVNRARVGQGRPTIPVVAHAHGTALKMFDRHVRLRTLAATPDEQVVGDSNLAIGRDLFTFLSQGFSEALGTGDSQALAVLRRMIDPTMVGFLDVLRPSLLGLGGIFAISPQVARKIGTILPKYPSDNIFTVLNGFNQDIFRRQQLDRRAVLGGLHTTPTTGTQPLPPEALNADHVVVFTGKFADWKGLDPLLHGAAQYEAKLARSGKTVVTLIIGSGSEAQVDRYEKMATALGLRHTYFLGMQTHQTIAALNSVADVGIYPSQGEPFGMVAIECLGCGTPVIAGSGGFEAFIDHSVGMLLQDPRNADEIARTVTVALSENWKGAKSTAVRERSSGFTWGSKVDEMLTVYERVIETHRRSRPEPPPTDLSPLHRVRFSPVAVRDLVLGASADRARAATPAEMVHQILSDRSNAEVASQMRRP